MSSIKLCINVDHIATVRQARGEGFPDPVEGAKLCEENGADGITVHLREDRRHIQDQDVFALKDVVTGKYNLEMALSDDIIGVAKKVHPDQITLVPEKREELTTEGGLDIVKNFDKIKATIEEFHERGVLVSLFIEPDKHIIDASRNVGADFIELHTGTYCNLKTKDEIDIELQRLYDAASHAVNIGLCVNAGHGLDVFNLPPILKVEGLQELHIGFSIIARSIFMGLPAAVGELRKIIA